MLSLLRPRCSTPVPRPEHLGATAAVFEDQAPPELLSHERYRVLQRLGAGGMGVVYKAEHRLMRRTVALKVISKELTATAGVVERFRGEVQAQARLSHPNLVQAHDAEQAGDLHFLVMEYVDGVNLAWLVDREGPLPVEKACEYVRQAALGLAHAFAQGLVHRDVKPSNLMVTPQGQVKVLDFGLARIADQTEGGLTEFGQGLGTPDFVAPEQIRDAHSVDTRADIYSLGCTLYFLLTGRPPFPEGNSARKVACHLEKQPRPPQQLRPELPAGVVSVVERMMAKNPAQRYQAPSEVVAALEPFCRPPQEKAPARGRSWLWWVAAAALLVGAGAMGMAAIVLRVETAHGTVEITTDDPDVQVLVKQQGKVVEIIDARMKRTVKLKTGGYELELSDNGRSLELSTNQFTLKRNGAVIVAVKHVPKPVAGPTKKAPIVHRNVLTVSKKAEDGGQFRTIQAALDKVEPGMTIRVLDDADYEEYLLINRPEEHRGVVLEATGKPTIRKVSDKYYMVLIRGVPGFILRGFRFESGKERHAQVVISGLCSGVILDRLDMVCEAHTCIQLIDVPLASKDAPIAIQNCTLRSGNAAIAIIGHEGENHDRPQPCGNVVIRNNTLLRCEVGVGLAGAVHKVHVVGNRILDTRFPIDLWYFLPGAADVLVANNTLLRNLVALRVFDDSTQAKDFLKGKNIRFQNNLVLAHQAPADLLFKDNARGKSDERDRPGDLAALLKNPRWRFSHNWREIDPVKAAWSSPSYSWIPARFNDRLQIPIDVLSRKLAEPNFLRPAKDSPLAAAVPARAATFWRRSRSPSGRPAVVRPPCWAPGELRQRRRSSTRRCRPTSARSRRKARRPGTGTRRGRRRSTERHTARQGIAAADCRARVTRQFGSRCEQVSR